MGNREIGKILSSPELKPFWDDVNRILEQEKKEVLQHEKIEHVKGVKAIERVIAMAKRYMDEKIIS